MDDVIHDPFREADVIHDRLVHELRNRLTAVKGLAQLLDRQVRRDDWQRDKVIDRLDRLQDEISQLARLLDDLDADAPSDRDAVKDQPH